MPGPAVKQGLRSSPPTESPEQMREWARREVHPILGQLRGATNSTLIAVASDYAASEDDEIVLVDASGGARTVTLPFTRGYFRRLLVKKVDSSSNPVTIAAQSGENIEGAASVTLSSQWEGTDLTPSGRDAEWMQASYSSASVVLPDHTPVVISASLGSDQNDYAPTGFAGADVVRLNPTANVNITGFSAIGLGEKTRKEIVNVGSNVITLKPSSGSSSSANRILMIDNLDLELGEKAVGTLQYDPTSANWRVM